MKTTRFERAVSFLLAFLGLMTFLAWRYQTDKREARIEYAYVSAKTVSAIKAFLFSCKDEEFRDVGEATRAMRDFMEVRGYGERLIEEIQCHWLIEVADRRSVTFIGKPSSAYDGYRIERRGVELNSVTPRLAPSLSSH